MDALSLGDVAVMLDIVLTASVSGRDPDSVLDLIVAQLHRVIACDAILLTVVLSARTRTAEWRAGTPRAAGLHPSGGAVWCALSVASGSGTTDSVRIDCGRRRVPFDDHDRLALELLAPRLRRVLVTETEPTGWCELSPREYEVLHLAATGRTNQEIGRVLFLAPDTVRKHLEHVYEKLGVHNRTEAAALLHRAVGPPPTHAAGAAART